MEWVAELVVAGGWERYKWLLHGFSTRAGGVSTVYSAGVGELNLGWTKEDDPACVRENRGRFLRLVGGEMCGKRGLRMVNVRQVHGNVVRVIREEDGVFEGRLETAEGKAVLEGDGLVTDVPGVLLGVGTADCVPVLVVDVEKRAVGAFHAGWRGTVTGIVVEGIEAMRREYGSCPEDLRAVVGPSIGACCYAVGEEVRSQFRARFGYADELFREVLDGADSKLYVDLWEANRRQLVDAGVEQSQIAMVGECTACTREGTGVRRYFSHRAERGVAGRMLNVIGIAK
ncbi:MAG TPA: peptidoglycan editing factor PgeF [Edaphobacter sp.]